ncbi:MAG: hypothetical protein F6J94_06635 [Moorea sp. SIO1F2]|uniref:hypothetical protein n=1 Tax=unclassified Moorena TaxID=2683338 RepID=UPI0013B733E7|nr:MULTISPECIES: hypothetical protein [unclassified Moorena]NEN94266.1 hypothetical protein [Moorena sp. SIO3I7]NEO59025.1 hypothetical protein [Moorena sp. SIO4G2]NEO04601.1 hypothetical protein [Moorena sp. SIO3I8]NEO22455.1 hypothetical protein [Moorena sp. SIO4A5]NEP23900.1 hypothetical protein [Moorena sp. SIO3I6]
MIGSAFAHPTPLPTLQVWWANGPDSRSNCQRYSICPPYATVRAGRMPTLPIPYSLFPVPCSLFPIPYSLFPKTPHN